MMRKILMIIVVGVFCFSSVFMLASCAKKQVQTGEAVKPAAPPPSQPVPEAKPTDDEAMRRAEAERQARLRELEQQERLRSEVRVFEAEHIYFDFDKSELKPEARAVLVKKAEWLRKNPNHTVRIEGHCDERGTNEYNLALGERRAVAAWKFLNALGISGDRMSTISYGEEKPADPGHNENAWAKNRRDEFKIIK